MATPRTSRNPIRCISQPVRKERTPAHSETGPVFPDPLLSPPRQGSVVQVELFACLLESDVVRQLQCFLFEFLIVPFHCHSPYIFGNFGTALLLYHSIMTDSWVSPSLSIYESITCQKRSAVNSSILNLSAAMFHLNTILSQK